MPSLVLTTNVKPTDVKTFVADLSEFSAETLGKPESYICVSYTYNETLIFDGTFEPAFLFNIMSLGNINDEANERYSKAFFQFFKDKLGVAGNRGYISFHDPGNANVGYNGTTFKSIFG